jgi:hypothetical protein
MNRNGSPRSAHGSPEVILKAWGRDWGRGGGPIREPRKRNGADLAADPTLTGVWAFRRKRLTPGVFQAGPKTGVSIARRSRRRRFRRGPGRIRRPFPTARRFRDRLVGLGLKRRSLCPKARRTPRRQAGKPAFRLCALAVSTVWDLVCPKAFRFSSLHRAAFAIASIRFQNPFSVAGLSAFVSEGPIPVSMSGRCASPPIRASAGPSSYPLFADLPVDNAG